MHSDYSLAPDKIEMKKKNVVKYQVIIADIFNITIGNAKNLYITFDKEEFWIHY